MRSVLALFLMVRQLDSSLPTSIGKVKGRKKGTETMLGWLTLL